MEKLSLHLNLLTSFPLSLLSFHKVWFLTSTCLCGPDWGEVSSLSACRSIPAAAIPQSVPQLDRRSYSQGHRAAHGLGVRFAADEIQVG
jgi:hypothetical protein